MFEYDQDIVVSLLQSSREFKSLFDKHEKLDRDVHEAEIGTLAVDDMELHRWKKEKLLAKDKMATIIAAYKKERSG